MHAKAAILNALSLASASFTIHLGRCVDRFQDGLIVFALWHNGHRHNSALRGRTPDEVYFGRKPANEAARFEPRKKYPRDAWCASPQAKVKGRRGIGLELALSYLDDRRQLPIIELCPAA